MNRIKNRLSDTDRRIRECMARIAAYSQRVEARAKNPLAAQQAEQLLPAALQHLKQLRVYRRQLVHSLEMETYLSPHERNLPAAPGRLPRHLR